jgi:hypothetical protein
VSEGNNFPFAAGMAAASQPLRRFMEIKCDLFIALNAREAFHGRFTPFRRGGEPGCRNVCMGTAFPSWGFYRIT